MDMDTSSKPTARAVLKSSASRFVREDNGTMTIFAIMMLMMMLLIGGIGVDLMRNEMERARLQGTMDRAVLAAADMEQVLDPEGVVQDYFEKAGLSQYLTSIEPDTGSNYRTVSARAEMRTPTRFMSLVGVDDLPVFAVSSASERKPKVEISLVLDISGSMRSNGRMDALRPAASNFIDIVLEDQVQAKTSVNLIPYAGQTNPGQFMFNRLNGVRYPAIPLDEDDGGVPDYTSNTYVEPEYEGDESNAVVGGVGSLPNVNYVYPNVSSCLEINSGDFSNRSLSALNGRNQVPHFMNWNIASNVMDWGWCPQDQTAIQYMQNDPVKLNALINSMRMHDGTGTHYAMKYAVSLLDPSSSGDIAALSAAGLASADFTDRPAAYSDTETVKYIVLMTDGQITEQVRPKETMHTQNPTSELQNRSGDRKTISSSGTNVQSFYDQCNLAKNATPNPIIIYTVAFDAPGTPATQMRNCATSPSHFYEADQDNISEVFSAIARQINQLRLIQ